MRHNPNGNKTMSDQATPDNDDIEIGIPLKSLLNRYSVGPKHLVAPAPTLEQILVAATAALRAPDRHNLQPFRFILIQDAQRPKLAELFADCARRKGKPEAEIAIERERANLGPALLAFVGRLEPEDLRVPAHEQWVAAGGALSNFLTALHMMGFGAKVLSGNKAADPAIRRAFCQENETLVGWIAAGTATKAPHPRESDNPSSILRSWNPD